MIIVAVLCGFLVAELSVYGWHRWVCHAGILRRFANDYFRRRHFHHHVELYSPERLQSEIYLSSCDTAFRTLGVLLLAITAATAAMGMMKFLTAGAMVVGMVLHAWLGTRLHELYHVSDETAKCWPPLRVEALFRTFGRLRRFHDRHHAMHGNYGLVLPLADVLCGTYEPACISIPLRGEELFYDFDPKLSATCPEATP